MLENNKKLDILLEVCNCEGLDIGIKDNKYTLYQDYGKKIYKQYDNLDTALIDLLPTMKAINERKHNLRRDIQYVENIKRKENLKEFLYNNLEIEYGKNYYQYGSYRDGNYKEYSLACEFELKTPILPLIKVGSKEHYLEEEGFDTDVYSMLKYGLIEEDEKEKGLFRIWFYETCIEGGGFYLDTVELENYNSTDLEEVIMNGWNR